MLPDINEDALGGSFRGRDRWVGFEVFGPWVVSSSFCGIISSSS
jgi:hypothetical protein